MADSKLKVIGAKKLRVIDASIMPRIVSGNTNAACVLIGEKGADMIIQEYGIKSMKKGKDELWNTKKSDFIFIQPIQCKYILK